MGTPLKVWCDIHDIARVIKSTGSGATICKACERDRCFKRNRAAGKPIRPAGRQQTAEEKRQYQHEYQKERTAKKNWLQVYGLYLKLLEDRGIQL